MKILEQCLLLAFRFGQTFKGQCLPFAGLVSPADRFGPAQLQGPRSGLLLVPDKADHLRAPKCLKQQRLPISDTEREEARVSLDHDGFSHICEQHSRLECELLGIQEKYRFRRD